jgi:sugar-specific transcriptional regulator TrmB
MELSVFEEKTKEILRSIGFSKSETLVYLELVKNNNATVFEISKKTNLHRANIYDSLRKLIEKGFVSKVKKDNKTIFKSVSPLKIKDYFKQKEKDLESIIPYLKDFAEDEEDEQLTPTHGSFAARQELRDLLKFESPIYAFGASKNAVECFGEGFLKEFHGERMKKKIVMKHIYNEDATKRIKFLNKLNHTEAKSFPEKFHSIAATVICDKRVVIFIFSKKVSIIKIENKVVADSYKKYFEVMWESALTV